MSIWNYSDGWVKNPLTPAYPTPTACPFCGTGLERLGGFDIKLPYDPVSVLASGVTAPASIWACQTCGWWNACVYIYTDHDALAGEAKGVLRRLSSISVEIPLKEVKTYLVAKYSDRNTIDPKTMEDVVGSIFSDFGYKTIVTSYGRDFGVDAYLIPMVRDQKLIAIQVKRTKNVVGVAQIREFIGALVLKRITSGIFITTSDFTAGSNLAVEAAEQRGIGLKLMNAKDLYDALKVGQRKKYESIHDEQAPFAPIVKGEESLQWTY